MSLSVFAAAAEAPGRDALVVEARTRTFAEVARAAAGVLARLEALGVRPGQRQPVALVADNTERVFVALHALIAAAVPVHLLHPAWSTAERDAVLRHAGVDTVLDDAWLAHDHGPTGRSEPPMPAPVVPADDRTLAIVHTSGSSGLPRGVVLSRRAFAASAGASAANLGWRPDDRWLLRLPAAHVGGLSILTRCLLARRAVVLADPVLPDPAARGIDALVRGIERDRVTLLSLVPTLLGRLIDRMPAWEPPAHLRAILLGGAAVPTELLATAADRRWPVLTTYGMSECCSQVATQPPGTPARLDGAVGRPLPGVDVRIRQGEIQVRGPTLFSGYHPPGAWADPFTDDGWFPTGDSGRLDSDGWLHVAGRIDDVIITGGENVEPREVEDALRALHGVRDAVVVGIPDMEWGERLCALVVPREAEAGGIGGAGIAEALRGRIAGFKIPRTIVIVDRLPLNSTGKVDRRAARDRLIRSGTPPSAP